MAVTTGVLPDDLGSSPIREPLQPRESSPTLSVPKRVRRKSSFVRRPDSSEEYPSPHDSIYEAVYISATNSDSSGNRIELIDIPPRRSVTAPLKTVRNDENRKVSDIRPLPSIDEIEFRYGYGTPLETITEQKSYTTIRTASRPKSADDVPYIPFLGHRDSFRLARSPRRKASFSLDDIVLVQKSYHEACATIEQQIFKLPISEVYAEPKTPVRAPPERPPTPDGMPSWTAAQNNQPRVTPTAPVQNALQRFFGLAVSGITLSSHVRPPNTDPQDRAASFPARGRTAPRFRPPRSTYGPIDRHPFANAPVAQVKADSQDDLMQTTGSGSTPAPARPRRAKGKKKLQRVRFTPSATARDSEMLSLQAAIESTSTLAINPLAPMPSMDASPIVTEPRTQTQGCPHHRQGHNMHQSPATYAEAQRMTPIDGQLLQTSENLPRSPDPVAVFAPTATHDVANPPNSIGSFAQAEMSTASLFMGDSDRSRVTSFSSTAYLISGGLRSPSRSTLQPAETSRRTGPELKEPFCWKCAAGKAGTMIGKWWKSSASCLCFVCCGFDIEDDMSMHYSSSNPGCAAYIRGASSQEYLGSRRVSWDHSLAGIS
ncbi:hypothetical protein EG329_004609 [Mollisiaceae sp. DMI_Dod_QoI]|nr:hypothetical protein EG329_004609 [Helotiales sp. DMI_Dod_QoI]